ncbi:MAG TPA: hypothetical protein VFD15_01480, partial [Clostridia bacterium]|nr:hypothetical protein [Clostridia bacterium]
MSMVIPTTVPIIGTTLTGKHTSYSYHATVLPVIQLILKNKTHLPFYTLPFYILPFQKPVNLPILPYNFLCELLYHHSDYISI